MVDSAVLTSAHNCRLCHFLVNYVAMTTTVETTEQPLNLTPRPSRLRPRRTINQLMQAIIGLLIGGVGQYFLSQDALWEGAFFFLIAIIVFVKATYHNSLFTKKPTSDTLKLNLAEGWRRNLAPWVIVIAISISFLGYRYLGSVPVATARFWAIYGFSLLVLLIGVHLLTYGNHPWAELKRLIPNRTIAIWLGIIILIALFMRLYNFTDQPFGLWYDEAAAGLEARRILSENDYHPVFYMPINISGQLLHLYAWGLAWFGDTFHAMRLISVAFGLGGVIAAYLFGREAYGPHFGLILAFLVAVMRWHVNFSRIAMTGIDTPFFIFLSLFFLVRLFRSGHLREAMWAGLTLGFGLTFYTAFRLYVAALICFAVLGAIVWSGKLMKQVQSSGWQVYLLNLIMLGITFIFVTMPLIRFAQDNPDEFWHRVRQTSILTRRDQADLWQAINTTGRKHALMFNVSGDNNGRHNLPGAPMLDPMMGTLFILGIGLAISRIWQPINTFFLLMIPLALAGGIFSVDFEAPQSLRSIGVIPAVIYFCGLSLGTLGYEARRTLQPLPIGWLMGPTLLVTGFIFYWNASLYFGKQTTDFASWNAFSTPETLTARMMAELGPEYIYYSSPFLTNHPSILFIAPDAHHQKRLTLPDTLPIREAPGRPVALFIHPDDKWIYDTARQFYPDAHFEILSRTPDGPPIVYFVNLSPTDLTNVQGVELRYAPLNDDQSQLFPPPAKAMNIVATWPDQFPAMFDQNIPFQAEWTAVLYASHYGPYSFRLVTPQQGSLEIDGNQIMDGSGEQIGGLPLAEGNHTIRVKAEGAPGDVALYWQPPGQSETLIPQWHLYVPPVSNHGLLGTYYGNDSWSGNPVRQRIDPFIDTYFHFTPLNRPYSVEWTGSLVAPQSGLYRLGLRAVPGAELYLNGDLIVNATIPNEIMEASLTLEAGLHDLRLRYLDNVSRSRLHLYWMPPSGFFEPIPTQYLWPPLGEHAIRDRTTSLADTPELKSLTLTWLTTIGTVGSAEGQFIGPRDIAIQSTGNLVVADTGNRRVQILDPQGNYLTTLTGEPEEPFEEPLAVVVNNRDGIFVLDSTLQWIYHFSAQGQFIKRFGGPTAHLFHPRGLNLLDDGRLVVADTGGARFVMFNQDGTLLGNIGGLGSGPGQFNEPTDVLADNLGTFYVAEAENNRIQRVDGSGNPIGQWAIPPTYAYDGPHLAQYRDGSLLVTESQSRSVLRYAPTGDLLNQWQTIGPVSFRKPIGVYFDESTNRLYVTDVGYQQIFVFEVVEAEDE